jgi:hypothetical protein
MTIRKTSLIQRKNKGKTSAKSTTVKSGGAGCHRGQDHVWDIPTTTGWNNNRAIWMCSVPCDDGDECIHTRNMPEDEQHENLDLELVHSWPRFHDQPYVVNEIEGPDFLEFDERGPGRTVSQRYSSTTRTYHIECRYCGEIINEYSDTRCDWNGQTAEQFVSRSYDNFVDWNNDYDPDYDE